MKAYASSPVNIVMGSWPVTPFVAKFPDGEVAVHHPAFQQGGALHEIALEILQISVHSKELFLRLALCDFDTSVIQLKSIMLDFITLPQIATQQGTFSLLSVLRSIIELRDESVRHFRHQCQSHVATIQCLQNEISSKQTEVQALQQRWNAMESSLSHLNATVRSDKIRPVHATREPAVLSQSSDLPDLDRVDYGVGILSSNPLYQQPQAAHMAAPPGLSSTNQRLRFPFLNRVPEPNRVKLSPAASITSVPLASPAVQHSAEPAVTPVFANTGAYGQRPDQVVQVKPQSHQELAKRRQTEATTLDKTLPPYTPKNGAPYETWSKRAAKIAFEVFGDHPASTNYALKSLIIKKISYDKANAPLAERLLDDIEVTWMDF